MESARILHLMLRVGDLQRSIDFYTRILGMKVIRSLVQPDERYSLVFLGYGDEEETCVLELTYNEGVSEYARGDAYGHFAIGVKDCNQACADIAAEGGSIIRKPGVLKGSGEVFAFVEDPDGYQIELVQRPGEWLGDGDDRLTSPTV